MKYAFIERHRRYFPVSRMCSVIRVSRSGYYTWRSRGPSAGRVFRDKLLREIRRVHQQFQGRYGAVKCWRHLRREGIVCGRDQVVKLRHLHGIFSQRRHRFVVTTRSRPGHRAVANQLNRVFCASAPNRVWVGDVTFVATRQGWLYLAVLLDLYSRKVVGWSMANRNDTSLVKACLDMAVSHRQPAPGLIHHTDRGATYTSQSYRYALNRKGIIASMSRKGDCWDNAVSESFFGQLKNEWAWQQGCPNREQARASLFEYIELFYNRQRLHQTLGYVSPVEYENNQCVS